MLVDLSFEDDIHGKCKLTFCDNPASITDRMTGEGGRRSATSGSWGLLQGGLHSWGFASGGVHPGRMGLSIQSGGVSSSRGVCILLECFRVI